MVSVEEAAGGATAMIVSPVSLRMNGTPRPDEVVVGVRARDVCVDIFDSYEELWCCGKNRDNPTYIMICMLLTHRY